MPHFNLTVENGFERAGLQPQFDVEKFQELVDSLLPESDATLELTLRPHAKLLGNIARRGAASMSRVVSTCYKPVKGMVVTCQGQEQLDNYTLRHQAKHAQQDVEGQIARSMSAKLMTASQMFAAASVSGLALALSTEQTSLGPWTGMVMAPPLAGSLYLLYHDSTIEEEADAFANNAEVASQFGSIITY